MGKHNLIKRDLSDQIVNPRLLKPAKYLRFIKNAGDSRCKYQKVNGLGRQYIEIFVDTSPTKIIMIQFRFEIHQSKCSSLYYLIIEKRGIKTHEIFYIYLYFVNDDFHFVCRPVI